MLTFCEAIPFKANYINQKNFGAKNAYQECPGY